MEPGKRNYHKNKKIHSYIHWIVRNIVIIWRSFTAVVKLTINYHHKTSAKTFSSVQVPLQINNTII